VVFEQYDGIPYEQLHLSDKAMKTKKETFGFPYFLILFIVCVSMGFYNATLTRRLDYQQKQIQSLIDTEESTIRGCNNLLNSINLEQREIQVLDQRTRRRR